MRAAVTRADAASGAAPAIPALITIETKLSVIKSDPLQITSTVNSLGSADLIKLLNFLPTRAQSAANNRAGACVCLLVRMTSAESIK